MSFLITAKAPQHSLVVHVPLFFIYSFAKYPFCMFSLRGIGYQLSFHRLRWVIMQFYSLVLSVRLLRPVALCHRLVSMQLYACLHFQKLRTPQLICLLHPDKKRTKV